MFYPSSTCSPPPHAQTPPRSNYLNAQAVREQQQRYREYVEEQRRRQADPFYGGCGAGAVLHPADSTNDSWTGMAGSFTHCPVMPWACKAGQCHTRTLLPAHPAFPVVHHSLPAGTPFEGVFGGGRRSSGSPGPRKYASEDVIDVSFDRIDD